MTEKRNCGNCKHLSVIVSQTSDYWCSMKDEYLNLIEQKEWRVLTDIIDNFKKSDEQLQKEWRTYGDVS